MKKFAFILLAGLTSAAFMASCTGGNSTSSTSSTSSASTPDVSGTGSSSSTSSAVSTATLSGKVSMSGSTSMEEIAKALAEGFNESYPDVTIDIQLGGSSTGAKNAMGGASDIGNISRVLKDAEKAALKDETIALDGIAVIVHKNNGVSDLTVQQILDIYTGIVTNWKDVGGSDLPIHVVGREAGSGTRDGFESVVGIKENAAYAEELTSTGAVQTSVANNENAIGYVSLANVNDTIKSLTVGGVAAGIETVQDGSYTLQRPFIMASKLDATPTDAAKTFLEYVLSTEGQKIVADLGLVPVVK